MEFQQFKPPMCHRKESERKKPKTWRPIFLECPQCFRPKVICSFQVGNPPSLRIWICPPCWNAQPSIQEIFARSPSMKDLP